MRKLLLFLPVFFLSYTASYSGNLKAGKYKVETICATCHGLDGQASSGGNSPLIPNITAQQKEYLIVKLNGYKSGKIQHPQMTLVAQMLSKEDIENVAEWYSSIKIEIKLPEIN